MENIRWVPNDPSQFRKRREKPRQEKEMEYSLLKKRCLSESKHTSKHWGILLKWMWAFGFSTSARDVRRQLEWLYKESRLLHICGGAVSIITLDIFSKACLSLWYRGSDPSAVTVWLCWPCPSTSVIPSYTVHLIMHASRDDALQMMHTGVTYVRTLVLPTCSD